MPKNCAKINKIKTLMKYLYKSYDYRSFASSVPLSHSNDILPSLDTPKF